MKGEIDGQFQKFKIKTVTYVCLPYIANGTTIHIWWENVPLFGSVGLLYLCDLLIVKVAMLNDWPGDQIKF